MSVHLGLRVVSVSAELYPQMALDVLVHVPWVQTPLTFRREMRNGRWQWSFVRFDNAGEVAQARGDLDDSTIEDLDEFVEELPIVAAAPHLWGYSSGVPYYVVDVGSGLEDHGVPAVWTLDEANDLLSNASDDGPPLMIMRPVT